MLKNTSPNKKHFIFVKHFCAMSRLFIRADLSLELSIYCSLQTLVSSPASTRRYLRSPLPK